MEIQIDPHTLKRAEQRGANEKEIRDAVETGFAIQAKSNRLGKAKVYHFNQKWRGRLHQHKRVEVFYVMENDIAVTVTVYVFYGKWESENANPV